jgi:glucose-1-phosphate thymidylyltransferase
MYSVGAEIVVESTCSDKAVVLARGLGQRMRRPDARAALDARQAAVAAAGLKALMPVGRPFLDYVLSALADAGYRRVCLVVGPEHDALRDYYGRQLQPRRLKIEFAVQQQPKGTADAVAAAESFAAGEAFTAINCDNYYPVEALREIRRQSGSAVALFDAESLLAGGNFSAQRLRRFAVGQLDERGFLRRIIEKPDDAAWASLPRPVWLGMNCWRFGPAIFDACRAIAPSPRGELEITAAVQYAIDVLGEPFRALTIRAAVLDLTSRADVAPVAAMLAGKEVCL